MINDGLNEQQMMLRKSSRDFLATECPLSQVRKLSADEKGYLPEMWKKMAELGWLGLTFPEQYGGCAFTFFDMVILLEEMGRACLPSPFFDSTVVSGTIIMDMASDAQKKELLPKISDGSMIICPAITEPGGDWTLNPISTKAMPSGSDYIISGTKILVPYAHVANKFICLAKTAKGTTLFLVDSKAAGVKVTALKTMADDKQFEVTFDNVKISRNDIIGKEDQAASLLKDALLKAAVAKCAEMVGGGHQTLDITVAYVKERKQFGVPVGSFQAVQHHCANMLTDVCSSRMITYKAAQKITEGLPFVQDAAVAKAWVSEAYTRIMTLGHQCIGGMAFMEDHDLPLFSKRAKAYEAAFGDADFQREAIATGLGL